MENALKQQILSFNTSARSEVFSKINSYRTHASNADEWLRLFKVLLGLSLLFTTGFGLVLHFNLVEPYLGAAGAGVFAGILTVFLELAKIRAAKWAMRDVIFGFFKQGLTATLMIALGAMIAAGAFWWSYYNSTQGVQYISQYLGHDRVERVEVLPPTGALDAKIAETKATEKQAWKTQWRGTTTWAATQAAKEALKVQALQEEQRLLLLQEAAKQQAVEDQKRDVFIGKVAFLLSFLGGKMEWLQLIIILGMVFCEHALWQRMKSSGQSAGASSTGFQQFSRPAPSGGVPSPLDNRTEYFNRSRQTGEVVSSPAPVAVNGTPGRSASAAVDGPAVSQCDTAATASTAEMSPEASDLVLQAIRNRLQGELANLKNENGNPETVVKRMKGWVWELNHHIQGRGFRPTVEETERFLRFSQQMRPHIETIEENGGIPHWNACVDWLEQLPR